MTCQNSVWCSASQSMRDMQRGTPFREMSDGERATASSAAAAAGGGGGGGEVDVIALLVHDVIATACAQAIRIIACKPTTYASTDKHKHRIDTAK